MDVEEQSGVLLSLFAQRVIAIHNDQLLTELMSTWKSKHTLEFNVCNLHFHMKFSI